MTLAPERAHREFSPSQADRFFECPGSANLLKRVPGRDQKTYALEGTDAHTVLEAALKNKVRSAREAHLEWTFLFAEELDTGDNFFYSAVQTALDYIFEILDADPGAELHVEQFVDPVVESAPGEAGGYSDIIIWSPLLKRLYIIDYKHGVGVPKKADCRQLKQYGAGVLYSADPLVDPNEVDEVQLVVIQPRVFHGNGSVDEAEPLTPFDIYCYLEDLDEAIARAKREDAPLVPGEVQCQFCDAKAVCPAREAMAVQALDQPNFDHVVKSGGLPDVRSLDLGRLGKIAFHASMIRKWLDGVEDHAHELVRNGHAVPGLKLVEQNPKRRYHGEQRILARHLAALLGEHNPNAAMAELEAVLKKNPVLDKLFNVKMVPLTTAEALVVDAYRQRASKGKKDFASKEARQAFAHLTLKDNAGNYTVVPETDPRPAVDVGRKTFAQVIGVLKNDTE